MRPASRAANVPFILSSTATKSRSSCGTNPKLSTSSFSRRAFSAADSGTRFRVKRSVGGMIMVVITAMVTISV